MSEQLLEIAEQMAQELRDIIADAEEAGCNNPMPATQALLKDWESAYSENQHEHCISTNG